MIVFRFAAQYDSLDPFGNGQTSGGSVPNTLQFAGREYDAETGLNYLRARYYDPALGRFISEDPAGLGAGMNPYAYAANDPANRRDPSGMRVADPDGMGQRLWVLSWEGLGLNEGVNWGALLSLHGILDDIAMVGVPTPQGVCRQSTYAGTITVDASIAAEAASFINSAVLGGAKVQINSSFRNYFEQFFTYVDHNFFGVGTNVVARPGHSDHEAGFAIDIQWNGLNVYSQNVILQAAKDFGFEQDVADNDLVHFSYVDAPTKAGIAKNDFTSEGAIQACNP